MSRDSTTRVSFAVLLALALLVPFGWPSAVESSPALELTTDAALTRPLAAFDGPSHHFGFGQASVLAQATATQTVIAAQATRTAAPTPGATGSGVCTARANTSCTISGNGISGSWMKLSSGNFSVAVLAPATAILNDGAPFIFLPTTLGVEQRSCPAPSSVNSNLFCSGSTVGDLLQGGTVTVRFVSTTGFQDVTGTVTGPGSTPGIQKTVSEVNGVPVFSLTGAVPDVRPGDRVTFRIAITNAQGTITIRDFLGPNLTLVGATTATCSTVPTPANRPAGVAANATTLDCSLSLSTGGFDTSFEVDATVNGTATQGGDLNANMACVRTDAAGTLGPCSGVSLNILAARTPTPTTGLQKVVTAVNGAVPSPSNRSVDVTPGSQVTFQIRGTGLPIFGLGNTVTITDFLSPNFTVNLNDVSGGSCIIRTTPANRPAGVSADATTIQCGAVVTGDGSVALGLTAEVRSNAAPGTDAAANVACLTTFGVDNTAQFNNCATVQARIVGATPTATLAAGSTLQQALAQVPPSGQPGSACADVPNSACAVTGNVNGQGSVTGSMRWTLTATVPAGVAAGTIPFAVFTTTAGREGFACAPVAAGVTTVTCLGTTAGNALQGSTVTVVFGPGVTVSGTVTGPGARLGPAPLLPPPVSVLAPPPPLLLPPPAALAPPAPTGAVPGAFPEVPVIPEADSLWLLLGGLSVLAIIGRQRARRRGRR